MITYYVIWRFCIHLQKVSTTDYSRCVWIQSCIVKRLLVSPAGCQQQERILLLSMTIALLRLVSIVLCAPSTITKHYKIYSTTVIDLRKIVYKSFYGSLTSPWLNLKILTNKRDIIRHITLSKCRLLEREINTRGQIIKTISPIKWQRLLNYDCLSYAYV